MSLMAQNSVQVSPFDSKTLPVNVDNATDAFDCEKTPVMACNANDSTDALYSANDRSAVSIRPQVAGDGASIVDNATMAVTTP